MTETTTERDHRLQIMRCLNDRKANRAQLEFLFGEVWNPEEFDDDFIQTAVQAPFCSVIRRGTGEVGTLLFQKAPRFYFWWESSGAESPDDCE